MKHTPGPWKLVQRTNDVTRVDVVGQETLPGASKIHGRYVCDLFQHPKREDTEANANAQLIAAAPEMLEALEQVDCQCTIAERNSGHLVGCFMPQVIEVLYKATGETVPPSNDEYMEDVGRDYWKLEK